MGVESLLSQIKDILNEYGKFSATFRPIGFMYLGANQAEIAKSNQLITRAKILVAKNFGKDSEYYEQMKTHSVGRRGKCGREELHLVMGDLKVVHDNLEKGYETVAEAKPEQSDNSLGTLNHLENSLIHKIYEEIIANPTRYHKESRNFTPQRKQAVKIRDDLTCQICNEEFEENDLEVDHIFPHGAGGSNEEYNLMAICRECNANKSAKLDYYRSEEGKIKLMENIKAFAKTLLMIHDFGVWLEKMGDKRRRK